MNSEPDWEHSISKADDTPVPPKIVDQLFVDHPAEPVDLPPKRMMPAAPAPDRDDLPSRTAMPPAQPERRPPPFVTPPENAQDTEASRVRDALPASLTPSQRNFLTAGLAVALTLNILLASIMVLMAREQSRIRGGTYDRADVARHKEAPPPSPDVLPAAAVDPPVRHEHVTDPDEAPGPLTISKVVLCRSISGFGEYVPIPDAPLQARYIPFIQAYVEITNPTPESRSDNRYIYHMTKYMKLFRSDAGPSEPLMNTALSLVKGGGMSPLRDLHTSHYLRAPPIVEPGTYTLQVRIADHVSGESASAETSFRVHAH